MEDRGDYIAYPTESLSKICDALGIDGKIFKVEITTDVRNAPVVVVHEYATEKQLNKLAKVISEYELNAKELHDTEGVSTSGGQEG